MTKRLMQVLLVSSAVFTAATLQAQDKFFTKSGTIHFESKGEEELIQADHHNVTCVLDSKSGALQFSVLVKGFEFKKALMQEHFNENYVESNKFPKSEFRGQITNNAEINYTKDGTYPAKVKGKLTLHGETKEVATDGKVTVKGGKVNTVADFNILLSDYKITIPNLVKDKVSNTVIISVNNNLEPLK